MSVDYRSSGHLPPQEHHYYRQATAPDNADGRLAVGDLWSDTTASLLKRCSSLSPITFVSVEGGATAHDLFSATHGDVDETDTPADGEVLTFNNATGKWESAPAGGHDEDHAARHAENGDDEVQVEDLASAGTAGQIVQADGSGGLDLVDQLFAINFIIDGGGEELTTGQKGHLELPFAGVFASVRLLADQPGSVVVDIWKDTYANFPPTVSESITASAKPTLSSAQKSEDTSLTGWTTVFSAGDILAFNVDSVSDVERVTLSLRGRRT
jgi:hypothetical protein